MIFSTWGQSGIDTRQKLRGTLHFMRRFHKAGSDRVGLDAESGRRRNVASTLPEIRAREAANLLCFDPPSHAAKRKTSASVCGVKSHGTLESISTARALGVAASAESTTLYASISARCRRWLQPSPAEHSTLQLTGLSSFAITTAGVRATIVRASSRIASAVSPVCVAASASVSWRHGAACRHKVLFQKHARQSRGQSGF